MATICAAAVQFEHIPWNKEENFRKIERNPVEASSRSVQLIAFPECCIVGYWFLRNLSKEEMFSLSEEIPGKSHERLMDLASRYNMTIGAGLDRARR